MNSDTSLEQLATRARKIREHVILMAHRAKSSHVGSCLSVVDLLVYLYFSTLRIRSEEPQWENRDRVLLSKGHAAAALYAVLAERGFFPVSKLESFYQDGSDLVGHVTHTSVPGIEVSTGALGHGLPIGCGMALAAKRDARDHRVFVILSDGECDEGSTWEAALFAPHHKLDNLVAIVDYNKIQSFGAVKEVLDLNPLADKWQAFGWAVQEIDGHDFSQIGGAMSGTPFVPGKPSCVVAHTIKGKGVSFMENDLLWHYRPPDAQEVRKALEELGSAR